jgi:hypothetical protein
MLMGEWRTRCLCVVPIVELQQAMTQLKQERTGRVACVGKWGETPFRMTVMELEERADRHHHSVAVVFDDVTDMLRLSDGMERDVSQHEHLADAVSSQSTTHCVSPHDCFKPPWGQQFV